MVNKIDTVKTNNISNLGYVEQISDCLYLKNRIEELEEKLHRLTGQVLEILDVIEIIETRLIF
jgi:chromosome segregation ATPase